MSQNIYCIMPGALSHRYPITLAQIERVCRLHGARQTFIGRLNNWNNQPHVICFECDPLDKEIVCRHIGNDSLLVDGYSVGPIWDNPVLEKYQYGINE